MRTLLLFICLALSIKSFAQEFTLDEMIKIADMNGSDFKIYVTAKGYVYSDTEKNSGYITTTYKYNDKQKKGYFINQTVFSEKDAIPNEVIIGFQTIYKEDYQAIKDQLKTTGFKFIKTEQHKDIDKNATWLIYKKGKTELSLISGVRGFNNDMLYEVSVDRTLR